MSLRTLGLLIGVVLVVDIVAAFVVPPFDEADRSVECAYPVCFIENNLHFPRPHEVWIARR